ncbi:MAG: ABC transporter, partial [Corynebacterium marinum]|nr:ABC transporter [Corynebacterium marinum]
MRTAPARTPLVVAVLGVVALVVIVGPLLALGIRVPWERFGEVLRDSATAELLRVTFLAAAWATLLTTLLGVPLALAIRSW